MVNGPEPKQYTAGEKANIARVLAGTLVRGKVTGRADRALERIKAAACERERIEAAVAKQAEEERIAAKVAAKAGRGRR